MVANDLKQSNKSITKKSSIVCTKLAVIFSEKPRNTVETPRNTPGTPQLIVSGQTAHQ